MLMPGQGQRVAALPCLQASIYISLQVRSNDDVRQGRASMDGAVLPRQTSNFDFYLQHRRPSQSNLSEAERCEAASHVQCSISPALHTGSSTASRENPHGNQCYLRACVAMVVAPSEKLSNGLALHCCHIHVVPPFTPRPGEPSSSGRHLQAPNR